MGASRKRPLATGLEVFPVLPPHGAGERPSQRWNDVLAQVRRRPGVWVVVDECATSARARNRAGFLRKRRNGPGLWEFSARTQYDGETRRHIVLGRWSDWDDAKEMAA